MMPIRAAMPKIVCRSFLVMLLHPHLFQLFQDVRFRIEALVPENLFPFGIVENLDRDDADAESGTQHLIFPYVHEEHVEFPRKFLPELLQYGLHHIARNATRGTELDHAGLAGHASFIHRVVKGQISLLLHPIPVDPHMGRFPEIRNAGIDDFLLFLLEQERFNALFDLTSGVNFPKIFSAKEA